MGFIAAPVAAWALGAATAAGATVATATVISAVAATVAVGAVTGAVIGAATAVISGGNILKGALKGALIGGITAGVVSGAGILTGLAPATSQLASMGVPGYTAGTGAGAGAPPPTAGLKTISTAAGADYTPALAGSNEMITGQRQIVGGAKPAASVPVTPASAASGMSDATARIYAGIGQGAMEGIGKVGAAKLGAGAAQELEEYKREMERQKIAENQSGEFDARVGNITIPEDWMANITTNANPNKQGLLTRRRMG
ncbi:MAG: hypothetical protein QME44_01705 [Thermodesulfobacteriota bacterium]|nr:hypothetical protein [Thermodesulfobacteriota bacterium]